MKLTDNHNEPILNIEGVTESDLKRNTFKTPVGYFEDLTPRVMERIRGIEASSKPRFNWERSFVPALGLATAVFAVWFLFPPSESPNVNFDEALTSISIEELTEYADLQPAELIRYDLVDYNQLELNQELGEEELLEYLEGDDEIDLNLLMDEIEI